MRKSILLIISLALCFSTTSAFAQCGGTERWAVKDGTDSSASQIDFSNIQPITVQDLLNIHQPHLPNDNITRIVPDETHLYRVDARLVKWKHETGATGDSDYHLVLTDDTFSFTDEHAGVAPTHHSFIGEIPDPSCLAGKTGRFGTSSPFLPNDQNATLSIRSARAALDQQFPGADLTGAWNDAHGMPVEVVGVGFFDRAHEQAGRAPNNIEIHPVLSISFNGQNLPAHAPVSNAEPSASAASQKWEYKLITASSAEDLLTNANNLGAQGWEMVGVAVDTSRTDRYVGYVKRSVK